jgi:hypothetical protein
MSANEIVKAEDFTFSHDQAVNNIAAAMQGILANPGLDLVIGGSVKPYISGGMNVSIDPVFAHCGSTGVDVVETEITPLVSIDAAHQVLDRIDIIQVRGHEEPYDFQNRKFRNPMSGEEIIQNIATKKKIILEVAVKKGENGSSSAEAADAGYVKLAEIIIPAGSVSINADNIRNITARSPGVENGNWTVDKARTFTPGYLADMITTLLHDHREDGSHKDGVIKVSNILFGNENDAVKGTVIPSGESMNIRGSGFNALKGVTEIMAALAGAVNLAYPYANNVLSRFVFLDAVPVAASTGNVDIAAGGEQTIDGIVCTTGQMVFLKDQDDPRQNGLWEVKAKQWNRHIDYESSGCFTDKFILVKDGAVNSGKIFYLETDIYTVGTDPLNFKESIFSTIPAANKIPIFGANKQLKSGTPVEDNDVARKYELDTKAPLENPTFTGVPTSPTAAVETNNAQIATTAFVKAVFDVFFYVGKIVRQYPDEPDPIEAGFPGVWKIWSHRAIMYGISENPPPSFVDYYALAGNSITAGSTPVVCYHQAGSDWRLYQFIAQTTAYTVPAELDPVKWTYLQPGIIDERQKCGNLLTADDYEIGDAVATGGYTGMYVTEIIVPGGKFFGVEGGFRPTFISGGVQGDRIREVGGKLSYTMSFGEYDGPFKSGDMSESYGQGTKDETGFPYRKTDFILSRVVPTGPDNAPTNLSARIWRRVA